MANTAFHHLTPQARSGEASLSILRSALAQRRVHDTVIPIVTTLLDLPPEALSIEAYTEGAGVKASVLITPLKQLTPESVTRLVTISSLTVGSTSLVTLPSGVKTDSLILAVEIEDSQQPYQLSLQRTPLGDERSLADRLLDIAASPLLPHEYRDVKHPQRQLKAVEELLTELTAAGHIDGFRTDTARGWVSVTLYTDLDRFAGEWSGKLKAYLKTLAVTPPITIQPNDVTVCAALRDEIGAGCSWDFQLSRDGTHLNLLTDTPLGAAVVARLRQRLGVDIIQGDFQFDRTNTLFIEGTAASSGPPYSPMFSPDSVDFPGWLSVLSREAKGNSLFVSYDLPQLDDHESEFLRRQVVVPTGYRVILRSAPQTRDGGASELMNELAGLHACFPCVACAPFQITDHDSSSAAIATKSPPLHLNEEFYLCFASLAQKIASLYGTTLTVSNSFDRHDLLALLMDRIPSSWWRCAYDPLANQKAQIILETQARLTASDVARIVEQAGVECAVNTENDLRAQPPSLVVTPAEHLPPRYGVSVAHLERLCHDMLGDSEIFSSVRLVGGYLLVTHSIPAIPPSLAEFYRSRCQFLGIPLVMRSDQLPSPLSQNVTPQFLQRALPQNCYLIRHEWASNHRRLHLAVMATDNRPYEDVERQLSAAFGVDVRITERVLEPEADAFVANQHPRTIPFWGMAIDDYGRIRQAALPTPLLPGRGSASAPIELATPSIDLPFCSMDHHDTMFPEDAYAGERTRDLTRFLVALASPSLHVGIGSRTFFDALDRGAKTFIGRHAIPMVHRELAETICFRAGELRNAMVVSLTVSNTGKLLHSSVSPHVIKNHSEMRFIDVGSPLMPDSPHGELFQCINGLAGRIKRWNNEPLSRGFVAWGLRMANRELAKVALAQGFPLVGVIENPALDTKRWVLVHQGQGDQSARISFNRSLREWESLFNMLVITTALEAQPDDSIRRRLASIGQSYVDRWNAEERAGYRRKYREDLVEVFDAVDASQLIGGICTAKIASQRQGILFATTLLEGKHYGVHVWSGKQDAHDMLGRSVRVQLKAYDPRSQQWSGRLIP